MVDKAFVLVRWFSCLIDVCMCLFMQRGWDPKVPLLSDVGNIYPSADALRGGMVGSKTLKFALRIL